MLKQFTKKLKEDDEIEILSPGSNIMLFAHGKDTDLAYHDVRIIFDLDL